jgi:gas vesicle protein
MDKREGKGLAIGAAIGAVAGLITGILFAPKSGKETRHDIKNTAEKAGDKVLEEAKKAQHDVAESLDKLEKFARDNGGKIAETAKNHAKDLKHKASSLAEVAKSFKAGEASDKDLDKAINQVKAARSSIKTFMSK